jgi:hypothetical protein
MAPEQDMPDEPLNPPDADRVARRALVASIVTCRGFIEGDASRAGHFWARSSRGFFERLESLPRFVADHWRGYLEASAGIFIVVFVLNDAHLFGRTKT